jgi:hypothetical protein
MYKERISHGSDFSIFSTLRSKGVLSLSSPSILFYKHMSEETLEKPEDTTGGCNVHYVQFDHRPSSLTHVPVQGGGLRRAGEEEGEIHSTYGKEC